MNGLPSLSGADRRQRERGRPPRPKLLTQLTQRIDAFIAKHVSSRGHYLVIVTLGILSCIGVWWSLSQRISLVDALTTDTLHFHKLGEEVDRLRALKTESDLAILRSQLAQAYESVLPGYTALAELLNTQSTAASNAGLQMSYRFLPEYPVGTLDHVLAAPLVVSVSAPGKDNHNGYAQLLAFAQHWHAQPWRQSLLTMEIIGEGKGASKLRIETELWFRTDEVEDHNRANDLAVSSSAGVGL